MSVVFLLNSHRSLTTTVSPYDFPMLVTYEYDEGEPTIYWPTDRAHPGSPNNAQLLSCSVGGVNIYDMLSSDQIERIEEAILELHED